MADERKAGLERHEERDIGRVEEEVVGAPCDAARMQREHGECEESPLWVAGVFTIPIDHACRVEPTEGRGEVDCPRWNGQRVGGLGGHGECVELVGTQVAQAQEEGAVLPKTDRRAICGRKHGEPHDRKGREARGGTIALLRTIARLLAGQGVPEAAGHVQARRGQEHLGGTVEPVDVGGPQREGRLGDDFGECGRERAEEEKLEAEGGGSGCAVSRPSDEVQEQHKRQQRREIGRR